MAREQDKKMASGDEMDALRRRISELEEAKRDKEEELTRLKESEDFSSSLLTGTPHPVVVVNPDSSVRYVNPAFERVTGFASEEVLGVKLPRPWWVEEYRERTREVFDQMLLGKAGRAEALIRTKDGQHRWVDAASTPIYRDDKLRFVLVNWTDITDRKRAEETVRRQSEEIMELSTPVMEVWDKVLVAPLIGTLDSQRSEQLMERILEHISESHAEVVLVDITGVPTIDTRTAQHLIDTITAARLLGATVVLTGVRPAIAQTLVHLGIDLSGVATRASLAAGLQHALRRLQAQNGTSDKRRESV